MCPPCDLDAYRSTHCSYDDMPSAFYNTGPAVYNGEGLPATPGVYRVLSMTG